jgi:hypothetical protein
MRTAQMFQQLRFILFRHGVSLLLFGDPSRLQLLQQQLNRQTQLTGELRYIHFSHYDPLNQKPDKLVY